MAEQQDDKTREPWVTFQDVVALAGIGCTAAGAHEVWGLGVALMVGGGLMLAAVVAARF
jgi:hypothetical protein